MIQYLEVAMDKLIQFYQKTVIRPYGYACVYMHKS